MPQKVPPAWAPGVSLGPLASLELGGQWSRFAEGFSLQSCVGRVGVGTQVSPSATCCPQAVASPGAWGQALHWPWCHAPWAPDLQTSGG